MSYKIALERMLAHEPKRLIKGWYEKDGEYCAIGVLLPTSRNLCTRPIGIITLLHESDRSEQLYEELREIDMTADEAFALQSYNDLRGNDSDEERYKTVVDFLQKKVLPESTA